MSTVSVANLEDAAIGVFDSGLGGLTVVRSLQTLLPNEDITYLGDTARVPYGTRAADTVKRYALGCADLLIQHRIKCLVVACNTASAVAIEALQHHLSIPVIGVIEPGASAALGAISQQHAAGLDAPTVGVLGTSGTIRSGAYRLAIHRLLASVPVVEQAAPLLVPLAEEGWLEGDVPTLAVERYLQPLIHARVTTLVLGCTHYPLFEPVITAVIQARSPHPIGIVDGAVACAHQVRQVLASASKLTQRATKGRLSLLATDVPDSFQAVARRFLGADASDVHQVDIVPAVSSTEARLPSEE